MKPTPILRRFLESGNLGIVSIGVNIQEVLSILGCPDGYSTVETFESEYLRAKADKKYEAFPAIYGVLEILFDFESDKVIFFKLYFDEHRKRKIPPALDDGWIKGVDGINKDKFRKLLNECGINGLRQVSSQSDSYVTVVWIPTSEIQINFDEEDCADTLLVISKSGFRLKSNPCKNRHCEDFT